MASNLQPKIDTRPKWKRYIQRPWYTVLHDFVSHDVTGNQDHPMRDRTIYKWDEFDDRKSWDGKGYKVATFVDGDEIGFGYHNRWEWVDRNDTFKKIVFRYLWIWAWHDWFGLRTRIWYWTLHRMVAGVQDRL